MKTILSILCLLALSSCAGNLKQAKENVEADTIAQEELSEDFGSAFAGDDKLRLEFLKGKISEKRQALDQLSNKELSADSDLAQMTEILESEILLMEAERFNLQTTDSEDMDDSQTEEVDENLE